MGRRSINTTKSGKYMNPTDQARKEARKKELKKNKKQRQMVRAAVLKNKDPGQILEEMEKIDEMEYNVLQPSPLNEKVLRDKRKKLKETFERVMRLYQTEEPELWSDLKKKEIEYEKKRLKKQQYYESVKHAQSVQIDEIPLPSSTPTAPASGALGYSSSGRSTAQASSLPSLAPGVPASALRKPLEALLKSTESPEVSEAKDRANVPIGPPPNLFHMIELDSDAENEPVVLKKYLPKKKKKSQQKSLGMSGQNIDDFMKEMESVHKKKEKEKEKERQAAKRKYSHKSDADDDEDRNADDDAYYDNDDNKSYKSDSDIANRDNRSRSRSRSRDKLSDSEDNERPSDKALDDKTAQKMPLRQGPMNSTANIPPVVIPLPPAPSGVAPHMPVPRHSIPTVPGMAPPMMYRPPPMRPPAGMAYGIRMPPGPPAGPRPRPPGMAMPPRMGIRMPPGPPPGMPPRLPQHKNPQQMNPPTQSPAQPPQMLPKDASKGITTITAKPQIRNLSADVTRFVPSALRVKREETKKAKPTKSFAPEYTSQTAEGSKAATKDDAYKQFMNEMQGLL